MNRANRSPEFLVQGVLQQVTPGTGLQRPHNLHVAFVGGQNKNSCFGKLITNRDQCIESAHLSEHSRRSSIRTSTAQNCPICAYFCNTSPYPNQLIDGFRCRLDHDPPIPSVSVAARSGRALPRTAAASDVLPPAVAGVFHQPSSRSSHLSSSTLLLLPLHNGASWCTSPSGQNLPRSAK